MKLFKTFSIITCFLLGANIASAEEAPATIHGTTFVDHVKAKELHDAGAIFLDVRGDSAYEESHIAGAEHLDVESGKFTQDAFKEIVGAPDTQVVIYCNGIKCQRSGKAAEKAVVWGYKKVYYFRGGYPDWNGNDYPTE